MGDVIKIIKARELIKKTFNLTKTVIQKRPATLCLLNIQEAVG